MRQGNVLQLTMVRRPSESKVFSIGSVSSRKSSSLRRNDDTESSKRPRPSWSFEQSRRTMGGFWLYCWIEKSLMNVCTKRSGRLSMLTFSWKSWIWTMSLGKPSIMIPFLFINCRMLVRMSLSRLSFDTISPFPIASLIAKFSDSGFGSDSARFRKVLPMLWGWKFPFI